jgi:DNA modification methylase
VERREEMRMEPLVVRLSDSVEIWHADCRDVLPVECDAIITDPPYPDKEHIGNLIQTPIDCLNSASCRQMVFWSDKMEFPLTYTTRHRWNKMNGIVSKEEYIYERNWHTAEMVWSYKSVARNWLNAQLNRDELTNHPTQKPLRLMNQIVLWCSGVGDVVCDPFMGSGTTGIACIRQGRRFIGVEMDAGHFATARRRLENELRQGLLPLEHNDGTEARRVAVASGDLLGMDKGAK